MSGEERREAVPAGYKMTEVGVIPEDWGVVSLGDLDPFVTSGSRGWAAFYSDAGSLFVRITNLSRSRIYLDMSDVRWIQLPVDNAEGKRTQLHPGDLLVSITADIGIIGYVDDSIPSPAFINQHIALLRIGQSRANSQFIAYFLASHGPQKLFLASTDTGAKTGMNLETVRRIRTALPPLPEQRAIAEALSDVDNLLDALDRLIAKKRAVKQAVMQQLLTGKTRLAGFAEEWEETTLGEIGRVNMGQSPPSSAYNFEGRGIGLVQGNADIEDRSTAPKVFTEIAPKTTSAGAIVMTVRAPVGKIAKSNSKICLGRGVCAIEPGTSFLYHALVAIEHTWDRLSSGSTFDSVNSDVIKRIPISWPSEAEQHAIAEALSDMDDEITALEKRRDKTRRIKEGMMQQLLTGRVRLLKSGEKEWERN